MNDKREKKKMNCFRNEVAFNHGFEENVDCCFDERATTVILAGMITHAVVSLLDAPRTRKMLMIDQSRVAYGSPELAHA